MPLYKYKALDRTAKEINGTIEAANEKAAIGTLRGQGLRLLEIKETKGGGGGFSLPLPFLKKDKIKEAEIVGFTRQLATLLAAGLPLLRCLNILNEQIQNQKLKAIVNQISQDVQGGASFSDALAKHPIFNKLYINMVKAGEVGGVLEGIMNRLAVFGEKSLELKMKIKGAMTYPIIMMTVAVTVVSFLLVAVLPTFVNMFKEMKVQLPAPTLFVIGLSDFLVSFWWLLIIIVVGVIIGIKQYRKSPEGLYKTDKIKLKIPVFGQLGLKSATAQLTRTLGTLLQSGVPILQALQIVRETVPNEVIARVLDDVSESIAAGNTMSEPLAKAKIFDVMVPHMIAVGEETGAVDQMLIKIADQYDVIVDEMVAALSSMLEPFLIIFMGGAVGLIVMALFLPMFELINVVG
ncbi:MAG TPA: type II secretion system F family protein [bacterium]|nr:type II secretion system F family protein [bacterium]HOL46947.1 type II secretion system F family protein [bacterium]HPQ18212.1 type II secretion system F family protein [bacterium]